MPKHSFEEKMKQKLFSKTELTKMRKVALEAALDAGSIQTRYFRKKFDVREKGSLGLVTEVDIKSENAIIRRLSRAFPEIQFRAEESSSTSKIKSDQPMWHIDPLDGTTNFAHGFPMYCVSIGLAIGDTPILGVIHAPSLGETWYAQQGGGAFLNQRRVQVSETSKIKDCLVCTGFSYSSGTKLSSAVKRFHKVSKVARAVRRPGAAALDIAYLSSGTYDAFWEQGLSSWDVCAGIAIATEAGAVITDYKGKPAKLAGSELLISNKRVHKKMMQLL